MDDFNDHFNDLDAAIAVDTVGDYAPVKGESIGRWRPAVRERPSKWGYVFLLLGAFFLLSVIAFVWDAFTRPNFGTGAGVLGVMLVFLGAYFTASGIRLLKPRRREESKRSYPPSTRKKRVKSKRKKGVKSKRKKRVRRR